MKKLSEQEEKFLMSTGWTPTIEQMDYAATLRASAKERADLKFKYLIKARELGVDIDKLYAKLTCESDGISLEDEAAYLLHLFFSEEELKSYDASVFLNWLKDFQYFSGFRKWELPDAEACICDALDIFSGKREVFVDRDDSVSVVEIAGRCGRD